jgi:serine protease Do
MHRWKNAGAVALVAAAGGAFVAFAPGVHGQDRRVVVPRAEREVRMADWFGAQIGVTVRDNESAAGVVVDEVRRESPAEKAGVKQGDRIVEFDGEPVRSSRQFARLVDESPQGKSARMVLERNGQRTTVDVTPEARQFGRVTPMPFERLRMPDLPDIPSAPRLREFDSREFPHIEIFSSRPGRLGVQVEDLGDQLAEYFGVKGGALVTSVAKESPGARAGIRAGDVIMKIGNERVEDTADVRREIRRMDAEKEFPLEVMREKKVLTLQVKLDPPATSTRRPGTRTDWF